jgi:hypothetical protein
MNDDEAIASYLACMRQTQIAADPVTEPAAPAQARKESPRRGAATVSKKGSRDKSSTDSTRAGTTPARSTPASSAPARSTQARSTQARSTQADSIQAGSIQTEELPDLQLPRAEHVRPRKKYLDDHDRGIPWRIVALAGVVIVLAVILWSRHSRHVHAQGAASAGKSLPLSLSTTGAVSTAGSYQTASAHSADLGMQPPPNQSVPAVRPPAAKPVGDATENASEDEAGVAGAARFANSPGKTVAPVTLIIRATENSWISVRADGQEVTAETLIAPAHTSVRATREIVVKTGNAAGINFLINGKEVPAQGAEAEVRTFTFDTTGLRTTPPAPLPTENQ